jgi:hypothetical protein
MNLLDYYNICVILKQNFMDEYELQNTLILLNDISHEYILYPNELQKSFNELVTIFSGFKLIFVDEKKGYCILDDISKIAFERITRGHPRFRVLV